MMMAVDGMKGGYCDEWRVWRILEIGIDDGYGAWVIVVFLTAYQ
jgi:hypothetical protein